MEKSLLAGLGFGGLGDFRSLSCLIGLDCLSGLVGCLPFANWITLDLIRSDTPPLIWLSFILDELLNRKSKDFRLDFVPRSNSDRFEFLVDNRLPFDDLKMVTNKMIMMIRKTKFRMAFKERMEYLMSTIGVFIRSKLPPPFCRVSFAGFFPPHATQRQFLRFSNSSNGMFSPYFVVISFFTVNPIIPPLFFA